MDNAKIHENLNILYEEYQNNKYKLNKEKSDEVVKLLIDLTLSKDVQVSDIVFELARFSVDIVRVYFHKLTESTDISGDFLDEILKEFHHVNTKSKTFAQKYIAAISEIMKNYKEKSFSSMQLPKLVESVAHYSIKPKSTTGKEIFKKLIDSTSGGIYVLDYSSISNKSLLDILNITTKIYPDFSSSKYEEFIIEWASKYGFIKDTDEDEKQIVCSSTLIEKPQKTDAQSEITEEDELYSFNIMAKNLYDNISKDIKKEHEIISNLILPITNAVESIQNELSKNTAAENITLNSKLTETEHKLSEQKIANQELEQNLKILNAQLQEARAEIKTLENQNAELDAKLTNAYSINSREASLEAARIRSELKKSFSYLYEDWLEYEFSDVSEENYESLQAIIKKVFRSLERNGINFKEND